LYNMIRYDQCRKCQGTDLSVVYDFILEIF